MTSEETNRRRPLDSLFKASDVVVHVVARPRHPTPFLTTEPNTLDILQHLSPPTPLHKMANEATPRINAQYLDQFTNQTVRIIGKIVSLRGETATLDASGSINIHLNRVRRTQTTKLYLPPTPHFFNPTKQGAFHDGLVATSNHYQTNSPL